MCQKHIRLIFHPKESFFSLIISCFLISFFSSAASHPWPPSTAPRPQPHVPFSRPDAPSPFPVSPKLGHLSNIQPPNQPGVPKTGTPGKHPSLKPARCPSNWDTRQTSGPKTCPMSQKQGHLSSIHPPNLPDVPVLGTSGWHRRHHHRAGTTTGEASPPGRHRRRNKGSPAAKDRALRGALGEGPPRARLLPEELSQMNPKSQINISISYDAYFCFLSRFTFCLPNFTNGKCVSRLWFLI